MEKRLSRKNKDGPKKGKRGKATKLRTGGEKKGEKGVRSRGGRGVLLNWAENARPKNAEIGYT